MMPLSKTIRFSKPLLGAELLGAEEREAKLALGQVSSLDDAVERMPYELEQIRAEAYEQGIREGVEQERVRYEAELSNKMQAAESILDGLGNLKNELVEEVQNYLPELVLESVGRVLAAWKPDRQAIQTIIDELLNGVDATGHHISIRLSPQALEILTEAGVETYVKQHSKLEFIGDARLETGECLLEGRFGLSDARYSAKLKNLGGVLHHE